MKTKRRIFAAVLAAVTLIMPALLTVAASEEKMAEGAGVTDTGIM